MIIEVLTAFYCSMCGCRTDWDESLGPNPLCVDCWDKCCDRYNPYAISKRRYYQENKDKIAEYKRRYYQENKDKVAEYKRRYYQENKDKVAECQRQGVLA